MRVYGLVLGLEGLRVYGLGVFRVQRRRKYTLWPHSTDSASGVVLYFGFGACQLLGFWPVWPFRCFGFYAFWGFKD